MNGNCKHNKIIFTILLLAEVQQLIPRQILYRSSNCEVTLNRPFDMIPRKGGKFHIQDEHGFHYVKDHQGKDGSSTWACKRRTTLDKCRAVIKVHGSLILWQRRNHTHDPPA